MLAGPRTERFESLDMLRGVAVLGIFAVNILAMAEPPTGFEAPNLSPVFQQPGGPEFWLIMSTFFHFKFITIFSALFGAGIILMVGEEKPSPRLSLHYRRMMWLAVIGAIHGFAIWYGDILLPYAISGSIVVLCRAWRPTRLLYIAALLLAFFPLALILLHFLSGAPPSDQAADQAGFFPVPTAESYQEEVIAYRGAFPGRLAAMLPSSLMFEFMQGLALIPRHLGVMMCGMALYKLGFFTARWSLTTYLVSGVAALAIGLVASRYGATATLNSNFDMSVLNLPQAAMLAGSLFHAFGYGALVMALCKLPGIGLLRRPFAAAGQMALTNYLMCSLIGVFIYWGPPGLGLIGTQSYPEIAQTVATFWLAILIVSPIWLSIFRFGPFEWLWRSLTYWRLQPFFK